MCLRAYEFNFEVEGDINLCILAHNKEVALKIIKVLNDRYEWLPPYKIDESKNDEHGWFCPYIRALEKEQFESMETWERL